MDEINLDLKEYLLQTGVNEDIEERLEKTSEHESIVEEVRGSETEKERHSNTHKNRKRVKFYLEHLISAATVVPEWCWPLLSSSSPDSAFSFFLFICWSYLQSSLDFFQPSFLDQKTTVSVSDEGAARAYAITSAEATEAISGIFPGRDEERRRDYRGARLVPEIYPLEIGAIKFSKDAEGEHLRQSGIAIYTDGSRDDEGTDSAFVVYAGDEEIRAKRLKLDRVHDNYQTESVATKPAIKYVKEMQIELANAVHASFKRYAKTDRTAAANVGADSRCQVALDGRTQSNWTQGTVISIVLGVRTIRTVSAVQKIRPDTFNGDLRWPRNEAEINDSETAESWTFFSGAAEKPERLRGRVIPYWGVARKAGRGTRHGGASSDVVRKHAIQARAPERQTLSDCRRNALANNESVKEGSKRDRSGPRIVPAALLGTGTGDIAHVALFRAGSCFDGVRLHDARFGAPLSEGWFYTGVVRDRAGDSAKLFGLPI
ncbi:hypothetical protein Trydic_g16216 [Trypoxylus dichotomus]